MWEVAPPRFIRNCHYLLICVGPFLKIETNEKAIARGCRAFIYSYVIAVRVMQILGNGYHQT